MEFPYSGQHDTPTRHLRPPNKIPSARMSSIILRQIGSKGNFLRTPQRLLGIDKSTSSSPPSESKALFLKTLLTYVIELGDIELMFS